MVTSRPIGRALPFEAYQSVCFAQSKWRNDVVSIVEEFRSKTTRDGFGKHFVRFASTVYLLESPDPTGEGLSLLREGRAGSGGGEGSITIRNFIGCGGGVGVLRRKICECSGRREINRLRGRGFQLHVTGRRANEGTRPSARARTTLGYGGPSGRSRLRVLPLLVSTHASPQ